MPLIHILSKLLPIPLYPVGMAIILGIATVVLTAMHRYRAALVTASVATTVLFVFSLPATAYLLIRPLERRYPPPGTHPRASAIVLLGGGGTAPSPPRRYPETSIFGDRLIHAARLYKQGHAPHVICTGGLFPLLHDSPFTEAANNAHLLVNELGVDSGAIVLADQSRNTREDVLGVVEALRRLDMPYKVILVTSAMHMERAMRLMEKQGIAAHPAPTDFHVDAVFQWKLFDFLPRADALAESALALHEYYGLVAYRILGWI
ncbi:MAG: YdcF family protein [Chitinivibrionales bacterium]|nr:YdcF family protein [Chitinivibrionales bacterium]